MCNFWNKYVALCNLKGESPSRVALNLGFSRATATGWKHGKKPNDTSIIKIVDYFNVSMSYFDDLETSDLDLQLFSKELSDQEKSMLELFRKLDEIGRAKLLVYASELLQ